MMVVMFWACGRSPSMRQCAKDRSGNPASEGGTTECGVGTDSPVLVALKPACAQLPPSAPSRIFVFMDYLLNVPKHKQAFLEELLKNFTFVKARKISAEKAERVNDMLDAITEMDEIEKGKRKPKSMKALLREL